MSGRSRVVISVFRAAFKNPELRKVGFAYFLSQGAEAGVWITLLIFAYGHGGSTAGMVMMLIELTPGILLAPFVGGLADSKRPSRMLFIGYGSQTVTFAGVALAMSLRAPVPLVFLLAPLTTITIMITRPTQAALLPAIVRTPEELTAANVMGGWSDGAASLVGPLIVGLMLVWRGAWLAALSMAGLTFVAMILIARVIGPASAVSFESTVPERQAAWSSDHSVIRPLSNQRTTWAAVRARTWSNIGSTLRHPQLRVLLVVQTFYFMLVGSLDLLCVILALHYLHIGRGGAGFLNAAIGGGALIAGFITAFLVGRRYVANIITLTLALSVVFLAVIDLIHGVIPVVVLLGAVGVFGTVFSVSAQTLFLRSAPSDSIAGSFAILESLLNIGLGLGAALVRVAMAIDGLTLALFTPAIVAFVLIAAVRHQLRTIDDAATVPQVEVQLLRTIPIFAGLPAPSIEALARGVEPVRATKGIVVITEGETGDCYYAVADGELLVTRRGQRVQSLTRGGGFGELALIRDVPRQATVTAKTDVLMYRIDKASFVETLTRHAVAASAAREIITKYPEDEDGG
ncbi:MAG TPA: MFS transporter [Acidimicrobiales bacterium]